MNSNYVQLRLVALEHQSFIIHSWKLLINSCLQVMFEKQIYDDFNKI